MKINMCSVLFDACASQLFLIHFLCCTDSLFFFINSSLQHYYLYTPHHSLHAIKTQLHNVHCICHDSHKTCPDELCTPPRRGFALQCLSFHMLSTLRFVRSSKLSSASRHSLATCKAKSIGTFVHKDTTSKDTNTSLGSSLSVETKETKSLQLHTANDDSPTNGNSSVSKNLEQ